MIITVSTAIQGKNMAKDLGQGTPSEDLQEFILELVRQKDDFEFTHALIYELFRTVSFQEENK